MLSQSCSNLGTGGIIVMDNKTCMVETLACIARFISMNLVANARHAVKEQAGSFVCWKRSCRVWPLCMIGVAARCGRGC